VRQARRGAGWGAWMGRGQVGFTLRQLEYFVAVCEADSVTGAAQQIPISQSSVSLAISQLEAMLGTSLLIRHHAQGVSPTPEGRRFLARARALLRDADELSRLGTELSRELSGRLELGCMVTISPLIAPQLCREFMTAHPSVTVEIVEGGTDELTSGLRHGRLSLALMYDLEPGDDDLAFDPLLDLPPYAIFAEDHPLARRKRVRMAELAEEPMVLLDLPLSREYFRSLFVAVGLRPRIGYRSPRPETVRTLVANGFGYTLVNARPRMDCALDGRNVVSVRVSGKPRPRTLGVASVRDTKPTRVALVFREHCRRAIAAGALPGLRTDP
jgi:DNA-binding transcriptional LysR family regulator